VPTAGAVVPRSTSPVSGAHAIGKVAQAEPQRGAAPPTEEERLRQVLAQAKQEASEAKQEASAAKRELEQMRRERDALKVELATALARLAKPKQVAAESSELLEDASPSTFEGPALPPPLVAARVAAPTPSVPLIPEVDEPAPSLSRMVVSTRPPAELETEGERSSEATDEERPSSIERRRRARIGCEFEVEFLGDSHLIAGLTQDISQGGVFIATYQVLPLGAVVSLGLELPSGRVVVQGVVRWRRDEVDGDWRPGLGIQFIDLDPETVAVLTDFCRAHPARYYDM